MVIIRIMEDSTDNRIRSAQPEIHPIRMDSTYPIKPLN
jgi:hypothetical protein